MKHLPDDQLALATGGLRLDDVPDSTNIDDRRGMTRRQSMNVKRPLPPPIPPLQRHPGDLASELGLDDIKIPRRRGR